MTPWSPWSWECSLVPALYLGGAVELDRDFFQPCKPYAVNVTIAVLCFAFGVRYQWRRGKQ